jgi:hypothetical protein
MAKPTCEVCRAAVRIFIEDDGYAIDDERLERLCSEAAAVPRKTAEIWAEEDGYFDVMVEAFRKAERSN